MVYGVYGGIWRYMAVYGGVWWCLVVYGGMWWHMVLRARWYEWWAYIRREPLLSERVPCVARSVLKLCARAVWVDGQDGHRAQCERGWF